MTQRNNLFRSAVVLFFILQRINILLGIINVWIPNLTPISFLLLGSIFDRTRSLAGSLWKFMLGWMDRWIGWKDWWTLRAQSENTHTRSDQSPKRERAGDAEKNGGAKKMNEEKEEEGGKKWKSSTFQISKTLNFFSWNLHLSLDV